MVSYLCLSSYGCLLLWLVDKLLPCNLLGHISGAPMGAPHVIPMPPETRNQVFERHAHECLDLVTHSHDTAIRATFIAMATTWLMLAGKVNSTLPPAE